MDVIADTRTVMCLVVVSENAETVPFSDGYLCHIRNEIVGDPFWIFSDAAAFVCADRIEITQKDDVPFWISGVKVGKDLLQHPFRPSIRVGWRTFRTCFCNRNRFWFAIYSGRRTENNVFYVVRVHTVNEVKRSCQVVMIVCNRF